MANERYEVAKAFISIVPSMEGSQSTISKELAGVTDSASESAGKSGGKKFGEHFATAIKATAATVTAAMAAVTTGAIAAGKAFINTANEVSSVGDAIGDNAAKMGISTKAYQEWDFVLQRAGTSIDSMKTAMKTLATAAVDGNDAFEAIGITQEQIASMSQEELFGATITALQNVEDSTTRTALAGKLLGKGAVELGAVFDMTAEETEAAKQKMYELGAYMDEDAIAASDSYQDTLIDLQDSIGGLKKRVISDFLPGITSVMTGLSKVFSGNGGVEEIKSGLEDIISNLTALAPDFFSLAETLILSLISGFGPMLPQLVSSIFTIIVSALTTITSMLPELLPVIESGLEGIMTATMDALPIIFDGLITLITSLVLWLSEGDRVEMFIQGIMTLVSSLIQRFGEILPILLPAIIHILSMVVQSLTDPDSVQMLVEAVVFLVKAIVMALVESLPEIGGLVYETIMNLAELLARFFEWAVPIVVDFIGKVVEFVAGLGSKLREWFANFWNNAKEKVRNLISNIVSIIKELPGKVVDIGRNLVEGIWDGISGAAGWLMDKIGGFCDDVVDNICDFFDIFSPSHIMRDLVGANLALGIGVGFEGEMDTVSDDMVSSMDGLTDAMAADVSAYSAVGAGLADDTTINSGNNTFNIYASDGMDVEELAQEVSYKIEQQTRRKEAAYA